MINQSKLVTGGNYRNDELRIWQFQKKTLKLTAQINDVPGPLVS